MSVEKLFSRKIKDENQEREKIYVTSGSWAGLSNGKGKFEIYITGRNFSKSRFS